MDVKNKRKLVDLWLTEGRFDVSPNEAAPILNRKYGYSLNLSNKNGTMPDTMGVWHGNRLRIFVHYLDRIVADEEKALARLDHAQEQAEQPTDSVSQRDPQRKLSTAESINEIIQAVEERLNVNDAELFALLNQLTNQLSAESSKA